MPGSVALSEPHSSNVIPQKKKFRTVLAFASPFKASSERDHPFSDAESSLTPRSRKSIDTSRSYTTKKKHRSSRSVTDSSFFRRDPAPDTARTTANTPVPSTPTSFVDLTLEAEDMKALDAVHNPRRPPVRIDTDGPWSVSVAETPNDSRSYSLYIKTPTHNLTLTRTAMEIVELDQKLREAHPDVKIPLAPIDATTLPTIPPKKKSTFLNTLSRLASPTSNKSSRQASNRRAGSSATPSGLPTPLTSPSGEIGDPFSSFTNSSSTADAGTVPSASTTSTAIAAYLTTVSNTVALRQARVWKRFVRVRTDDLESVRVERAIKRVRSDLAAHGGTGKDKEKHAHAHSHSRHGSVVTMSENRFDEVNGQKDDGASVSSPRDDGIKEEDEGEEGGAADANAAKDKEVDVDVDVATVADANGASKPVIDAAQTQESEEKADTVPTATIDATTTESSAPAEENPSTPIADSPPSRILRSQSADPDKSSRLSLVYTSSSPSQEAISQTETGDDSSISTRNGSRRVLGRKKRSQSTAPKEPKKSQRKVVINDFEMMRVLGKGCAGKVLLVRHKSTADLFALKAITKRHVLAHQELQHTLTEQAVLKRMAAESRDPFVVKLWWSFHDKENLFLVMDFHPGGDLATQLARWGRLGRDRARFYAAEIVEGVEGLHAAGVIYRDLKPENILIGADGHIVLTDFGLSKEFPRKFNTSSSAPMTPRNGSGTEFYSSVPGTTQPATPPWMKPDKNGELAYGWPGQPIGHSDQTTTFCGTAEYLAPEVIQGLSYSYEVDWWSFGTMLYEMLTGITPFWANNHSDMYVRVLQDELQFPDDRAIDQDTKSLIRGLLQRNPALRICEPRIKKHPYFSMIDWSHVYYKRYIPPYIPPIDPSNASDTQNFDDTFLDMEPVLDEYVEETTDNDADGATDTDRTDGEETSTTPSQSRSSSVRPVPHGVDAEDDTVDVFDGYSFKGRHSVIIDDDEDEDEDTGSEGDSEYAEDEDDSSILKDVPEAPETAKPEIVDDEAVEPKTPEARPVAPPEPVPEDISELPPAGPSDEPEATDADAKPSLAVETAVEEAKPRKSKELPSPGTPDTLPPPPVPAKEGKKVTVQPKPAVVRPAPGRPTRNRREKSGVAALDRFMDEDTEVTTEAERDEEDDDWDFVEAVEGEDRNGTKGTSLFARGVVDRYRLAVFRKASTPSQRSQPRSFSGTSKNSEATVSEAESPSSQRRGRSALAFRKHPRPFLQPKTPPSSYSSKTSMSGRSGTPSNSNTLTASSSSGGLFTSSPSAGGSLGMAPSLKSKESALSVGAQSLSSDQSGNGPTPAHDSHDTTKGSPPHDEPEKQKTKKLKKYKENAEKVFSLFSSPRPSQQPL